jgi:plasmid stabilization system protein ParE
VRYPIRRRLKAQQELERYVDRIAEDNPRAAIRFIDAVEASLELLSRMPEAGPQFESENPELSALRKWVMPRYTRDLLFYAFENETIHLIDVVDAYTEDRP